MINANLEQFLDTGMLYECSLYYHEYLYYLNAYINEDKAFHYEVYKVKSVIVDSIYQQRISDDWQYLMCVDCDTEATAKKVFFEPPFEGKTFWAVEKDLAWYGEV